MNPRRLAMVPGLTVVLAGFRPPQRWRWIAGIERVDAVPPERNVAQCRQGDLRGFLPAADFPSRRSTSDTAVRLRPYWAKQ
jgi:hypothetical protein